MGAVGVEFFIFNSELALGKMKAAQRYAGRQRLKTIVSVH